MPSPAPTQDEISAPTPIETYQPVSVTPKDKPRQTPPEKVGIALVEEEKVVVAAPAAKPTPKPVVIRDVPDDFWDDGE